MESQKDTVVREGHVLHKRSVTDQVFQSLLVREWSDGFWECYLAHESRWVKWEMTANILSTFTPIGNKE